MLVRSFSRTVKATSRRSEGLLHNRFQSFSHRIRALCSSDGAAPATTADEEPLGAGDVGKGRDTYAWSKGSWVAERPFPVPQDELDAIPTRIHDLADRILALDMVDMSRMTEYVAFKMGKPMLGGGGGSGGGASGAEGADGADAVEEKTDFDVVLKGFDAKSKIKIIKEVRTLMDLGLKEAKEVVEGAPKPLKKGLDKDSAEELKAKLEALGAEIELE